MSRVYEALAARLAEAEFDTAFGVMGAGVDVLIGELVERHGVRYVPTRHEHVAMGMADGYSRAAGRPGLAIISADAGLTNAATAWHTAQRARSRVVAVVGDTATSYRWDLTRPSQRAVAAGLGASVIEVSAAGAVRDLEFALREVEVGTGPVMLFVAWDTITAPERDSAATHRTLPRALHRRARPDEEGIDAAAALLATSRRPIILAGLGAYDAAAREALIGLAGQTGALLATTLPMKGWFAGEAFNVGVSGSFATDEVSALLSEADLVLAFGAALNNHTLGHGIYHNARIVQVDRDPQRMSRFAAVDLGLVGDCRLVAESLALRFGALSAADLVELGRPPEGWRSTSIRKRIAALDKWRGRDLEDHGPYANPYAIVAACDDLLPKERLLTIDIGLYMGFPAVYLEVGDPPAFIAPWENGNIGCGLGPAIGAALARPELYPVFFVGDGGISQTLADLHTAVQCDVPLLTVVMDDGGFGAERRLFRARGQSPATADSPSPDFAALARGFGMDAHTVASGAEMRKALANLDLSRATLIHVLIDPEQPNPEMDKAIQGP